MKSKYQSMGCMVELGRTRGLGSGESDFFLGDETEAGLFDVACQVGIRPAEVIRHSSRVRGWSEKGRVPQFWSDCLLDRLDLRFQEFVL